MLSKALGQLLPLLDDMILFFNADLMLQGETGVLSVAVIMAVKTVLRKANIKVFGHALRVLRKALERTAHKLEGCWCRPHVWMDVGKSYKRGVDPLCKETGRRLCVWKTRMGSWFVAEGLEQLFHDIMTCTTPELNFLISEMPEAMRSVFVDIMGEKNFLV